MNNTAVTMIHIVLASDSGNRDVLHLEIKMTIVEVSKFADIYLYKGKLHFHEIMMPCRPVHLVGRL